MPKQVPRLQFYLGVVVLGLACLLAGNLISQPWPAALERNALENTR